MFENEVSLMLQMLGLGIFLYLAARVLFGWYNLGCWIVNRLEKFKEEKCK